MYSDVTLFVGGAQRVLFMAYRMVFEVFWPKKTMQQQLELDRRMRMWYGKVLGENGVAENFDAAFIDIFARKSRLPLISSIFR